MTSIYIFLLIVSYLDIVVIEALAASEKSKENMKDNISEQLEQIQEYNYELHELQMSLNELWNKTKDLIQGSIDANQLPVVDIFNEAREKLKMDTSNLTTDQAQHCKLEMENKFLVLYSRISQSLFSCISTKSRNPLKQLLDAQDALDDGLQRIISLEEKFQSCHNKTTEEKICTPDVKSEEKIVENITTQVNGALTLARALPSLIMRCSEKNTELIITKVPKIVDTVLDNCTQK